MNRYIIFGRGICEKYHSRDQKFPEPKGKVNLVSRLIIFFLFCHRKCYINWTSFKTSPVLLGNFSLSQRWPLNTGLTVLKNEFVTWMIYRIIFKGRAVVMCQNKSLYDKQMWHLAFEIKLSNKTIICSVIKILGIFFSLNPTLISRLTSACFLFSFSK